MTSYVLNHLPKTYRGRVNWYVSPHHGEIHLFNTQREAIDYASQLPAFVDHFGIVFRHQIDWLPYGENGRIAVSATRPIIDHRTCERRAVGYQNGRMVHIGAPL